MTTTTDKKTEKPPEKKPMGNALQQALKALSQMSDEEREQAAQLGLVAPYLAADDSSEEATKIVYGYQCRDCRAPGLYFVGTKFRDEQGQTHDLPPLNVHISRLPWAQNIEPRMINRGHPHCQNCGCELQLSANGGVKAKLVIHMDKWAAKHTEAMKDLRKFKVTGSDPAGQDPKPIPGSIYDEMDPTKHRALKVIADRVHLGELAFGKAPGTR